MDENTEESVELGGWHVISAERLMSLLKRAYKGEDPDLLYAEEWANAEHQ